MTQSFIVSYSLLSFPGSLFARYRQLMRPRPVYAGCVKHNDSLRAFSGGFKFADRIYISVSNWFKFVLYSADKKSEGIRYILSDSVTAKMQRICGLVRPNPFTVTVSTFKA